MFGEGRGSPLGQKEWRQLNTKQVEIEIKYNLKVIIQYNLEVSIKYKIN